MILGFAGTLVGSPVGAQQAFYLQSGDLLSPDAPGAGAATQTISVNLAAGASAVIATFTSNPLAADVADGTVTANVFLASGRVGMAGCADVTANLVEMSASGMTTVASGALVTSLVSERQVTSPIVVPMGSTAGTIATSGERLEFELSVMNACAGARDIHLLYGSATDNSEIAITPPPPTTSTTSTTLADTTTTTTFAGTTPTSTTLPPPSCLDTTTGLAAVECRLALIDSILRKASPSDLGGAGMARRLTARVARALSLVRAAERRGVTNRRLHRARRQVVRFGVLVAESRVMPDLRTQLGSLAMAATGALDTIAVTR